MIENRLRNEYPSEELSEKGDVKTTSLSFSHWRDSFGSTGSTVRTMDLCIADMFLCHYINATKIDCELDPRVKKLL